MQEILHSARAADGLSEQERDCVSTCVCARAFAPARPHPHARALCCSEGMPQPALLCRRHQRRSAQGRKSSYSTWFLHTHTLAFLPSLPSLPSPSFLSPSKSSCSTGSLHTHHLWLLPSIRLPSDSPLSSAPANFFNHALHSPCTHIKLSFLDLSNPRPPLSLMFLLVLAEIPFCERNSLSTPCTKDRHTSIQRERERKREKERKRRREVERERRREGEEVG